MIDDIKSDEDYYQDKNITVIKSIKNIKFLKMIYTFSHALTAKGGTKVG